MKDEKNKSLTNIRAYKEDREKMNQLAREVSMIQAKAVRVPEVIRRINNSAEIKLLLKKDAYVKKMNRKGDMDSMFRMGFVFVIIIAIFFIIALIIPIGQNTFSSISSTVKQTAPSLSPQNNQSGNLNQNATPQINYAVDQANSTIQASGWIPYASLVALFVLFIVLAINVRSHPSTIFIWIGFIVLLTALTFLFSNSYESVVNSSPSLYASQDSFTDFLSRNLPVVVAVFGLIGGAFMFLIIPREPEYEVSQQ